MFMTDRAREVYLEWEPEARAMLGRFRLAAARYPGDPDFEDLIAELRRDSEHVRNWWPRHDVTAVGSGSKKLRHPRLGPTDYSHVVLQVADNPDQTLVTYSAVAGVASEANDDTIKLLDLLGHSWKTSSTRRSRAPVKARVRERRTRISDEPGARVRINIYVTCATEPGGAVTGGSALVVTDLTVSWRSSH